MIDRALNRMGIGLALFFMASELTYVNAKSLIYLVQEFESIDRLFAVIGSLAYSIVTIIVMRKTTQQWVKIVFPLFDVALVFCGFNLKYADAILEGTDNPVRFWLTVFFALFTGFITYCLGLINYTEHTQTDIEKVNSEKKLLQDENTLLKSQLEESLKIQDEQKSKITLLESEKKSLSSQVEEWHTECQFLKSDLADKNGEVDNLKSDLVKMSSEFTGMQSKIEGLETELVNRKTQIKELQTELKTKDSDLARFRESYLISERSRILKKKPQNRTEEENRLLEEAGEVL